tara:strand:+ start:2314 stop:2709 length:396 start_codon:yes stop_codon:yes gene_type:complete
MIKRKINKTIRTYVAHQKRVETNKSNPQREYVSNITYSKQDNKKEIRGRNFPVKRHPALYVVLLTFIFIIFSNPRIGYNSLLNDGPYLVFCNLKTGFMLNSRAPFIHFVPGLYDGGPFSPLIDIRVLVGCY